MLPSSLKFLWLRISYTVQSFYFCLTKFCLHKVSTGELLFKMKNKSLKRIENKKKKMAALLEISQLNEYDRNVKKLQMNEGSSSNTCELEPSIKKPRTESHTSDVDKDPSSVEATELGPSGKPKLSGAEFQELKKMLREKTNKMRQQPVFKLRDMGMSASLKTDLENRVPLFLSDLQHLIMYSQLGHHSPYSPARWCALERFNKLATTCVLIIENMTLYHFMAHESMFPFISSKCENKLEILSTNLGNTDIVKELSMVPLTGTQVRKFCDQYGTLEEAVLKSSEVFDTVRNLFPIEKDEELSHYPLASLPPTDRFPRTQLLLSGWQMVEENFPLPIKGLMESKYAGYVLTKDKYKDVTPSSKMFGIDCEMCKTTIGDLELTRVSVVDEDFNIFYDTLVKPDNRITDYLTRFSGITHKMMRNIKTTLQDVQEDLRRLLPADAILVGQSLGNDLHALKMMHPYVIDTSVIFNITGDRSRKTKLKTLTSEFLSERIQEGKGGHCSTEDSMASLKLAQLKLTKSLYFGDAVMGSVENIRNCPDLGTYNYATSMLKQTTKVDKTALVVGFPEVTSRYKYYVDKGIEMREECDKIKFCTETSCKDVVKKLCDSMGMFTLNIGHMNVEAEHSETTKVFKNIDKWIKDIYEKMPAPGLIIIVFSGSEGSNGSCFIQIKSNI